MSYTDDANEPIEKYTHYYKNVEVQYEKVVYKNVV